MQTGALLDPRGRLLDRLAHMTEARDNARAEVERLTAMVRNIRAYCEAFVEESEDSDPEPWNPAAYVLSILDGADEPSATQPPTEPHSTEGA